MTAMFNSLTIIAFTIIYGIGLILGANRFSHELVASICSYSVVIFMFSQFLFSFSNKKTSLEKNILLIGVILLCIVSIFRTLNDIYFITNIRSLIWPYVGLTFVVVGCITICFIRDGIFKGYGRNQ